ncbi:MAG TPA: hypothetical protein VNO86_01705 [Candidatus Binatia bacterium]|nr:hypothetical protein [Candidatus Binatia bacterium]
MIALWHPVAHDGRVASALEATLHGRLLRVERRAGEAVWRWSVRCRCGREIGGGTAADAHSAERAAEDEVYKIHPPTREWPLLDE